MSRIPTAVVDAVLDRAGWACECCNEPLLDKRDMHHRQARGMGGGKGRDLDTEVNILVMSSAHHHWYHEHPTEAIKRGIIVPSWADPADVVLVVKAFPKR